MKKKNYFFSKFIFSKKISLSLEKYNKIITILYFYKIELYTILLSFLLKNSRKN